MIPDGNKVVVWIIVGVDHPYLVSSIMGESKVSAESKSIRELISYINLYFINKLIIKELLVYSSSLIDYKYKVFIKNHSLRKKILEI